MSENSINNSTATAEPPEVTLTASRLLEEKAKWLVVAKNRRVNREWEKLIVRHPENTSRCYLYLCTSPMTRQPKRVFPLKGKAYKGVWEYELTGGERVFYIPDESKQKVLVYYAGNHTSSVPKP